MTGRVAVYQGPERPFEIRAFDQINRAFEVADAGRAIRVSLELGGVSRAGHPSG